MNENKEITKQELVETIAEKMEVTQVEVRAFLDALSQTVMDLITENDKVILGNLGKLVKTKSAARIGRHPKTGEPLEIPAKWKITYRPSKEVKDHVEGDK